MLVLSRKKNQSIVVTPPGRDEIEVVIVEIRGDKVRLGFNAPRDTTVHRREVQEAIKRQNRKESDAKASPAGRLPA